MSDSPSELKSEAELPFGLSYGWFEPEPSEVEEDLWLRFDAKEILPVRVVSPDALKYIGHWFPQAGTYRLCQAQRDASGRVLSTATCPLCPRPPSLQPAGKPVASPPRKRHILTVETPTGAQRIWEFSEAVAAQLQAITGWQRSAGGKVTRTREILGLRLLLSRLPPKSNGACIVQLDPDPAPRGDMPTPIDAGAYVAETWRRAALRDGKAMPKLPGFG